MQFSFESFFQMIESRLGKFGRPVSTGLLALIGAAVGVFCISTIWTLGVRPTAEWIGSFAGGTQFALPEDLWTIAISAVVLGVVPTIGFYVAARVFSTTVARQLSGYGLQQAALELRYERRPPYWLESISWYRIGVYNYGPATAMGAKVRLLRIGPDNPLPEYLLPSRLGWKGGGGTQNITPRQERELDICRWGFLNEQNPTQFLVQFWIDEGPALFELKDGRRYSLLLEATALNAETTSGRYAIWREGAYLASEPLTNS